MDNIVTLERDRPRPSRLFGVPRSGARILFFTGVRYCREDDGSFPALPEAHVIHDRQVRAAESGLTFDLAAH